MEGESNIYRKPIAVLIVIALVVVAGLIYIGQKYATPTAPSNLVDERVPLTEAEKAEILKSLRLPPNAPRLTQEEKNKILESLRLPPGQKVLTPVEKAAILESLR